MTNPVQTILVPVINEIPKAAIEYAKMLSEAYNKPISLLCLNALFEAKLRLYKFPIVVSSKKLVKAVESTVLDQDSVMLVWEHNSKRYFIQQQLLACRQLRIPYFFVSKNNSILTAKKVALPMSFLIEDREKATWGRSLHRYFESQFTILKPKDKGTRAARNVTYVEEFFDKNDISYTTLQGKKSSFKNDKEVLTVLSNWADLILLTASREYGLDDQFLGPKELHIIRKSTLPIMILNPRGDLYILCGD